MGEQGWLAVEQDHRGVGQDRKARARRIAVAEQEIAVATLEIHGHAGAREGLQALGNETAGVRGIVVAYPGFEQVAEDVERVRSARFAVEEAPEQFGDRRTFRVEVQVGNE